MNFHGVKTLPSTLQTYELKCMVDCMIEVAIEDTEIKKTYPNACF